MKKVFIILALIVSPIIVSVLIGVYQGLLTRTNNRIAGHEADQRTAVELGGRKVSEKEEFAIWERHFDEIKSQRGPANE